MGTQETLETNLFKRSKITSLTGVAFLFLGVKFHANFTPFFVPKIALPQAQLKFHQLTLLDIKRLTLKKVQI